MIKMKKIKTEEDMKHEFKLGGLGPAMAYRDENHLYEKYSEAKQAAIQLMTEELFCYGVCVKFDFDSRKFYVDYVRSVNKSLNDAIKKGET